MKRSFLKLIAAMFLVVLVATAGAANNQTTLTGVLTDDMCTKKHMMPGKANADCVRECIKHGAKYVVVSSGKVYELSGKKEQFDPLAGKKVKLVGELKGKSFAVESIESAQ